MSIPYKLVARQDPRDRTAPAKFYAQAVSKGRTDLRPLANRISRISTVSTVDTMATLEALVQLVPEELANGNIVGLGDLGSFYLTVSSDGTATEDEFSTTRIRRFSVRFHPGKLIKEVIGRAGYKRVSK